MLCETTRLSRRALLGTGGALFAWSFMPWRASAAGPRDPRFVAIILRGALDGLSAVAPVGDPDYAALRQSIALSLSGETPALPLDGFFALHPAMPNFARLYAARQALVVHAVATPYRQRSHFDGQDVLESGLPGLGPSDSGWLNRALSALRPGQRVEGLGVGAVTPLVIRGSAPVLGWAPQGLPPGGDDLATRVLDLYAARDPVLAAALSSGLVTDRMATQSGLSAAGKGRRGGDGAKGMEIAAAGAARLMARPDGPRVAALAFDGWDTHANEGGATGRLAQLLAGLDAALAAFEQELGPAWSDTVLAIVTEFGRTAHVNGTTGTDHGTATVALLAGGAVRGGRVVSTWPGLKTAALYEGRDLAPTTDLRAVLKGVMADHLGLPATALSALVFPDSGGIVPMRDLIA